MAEYAHWHGKNSARKCEIEACNRAIHKSMNRDATRTQTMERWQALALSFLQECTFSPHTQHLANHIYGCDQLLFCRSLIIGISAKLETIFYDWFDALWCKILPHHHRYHHHIIFFSLCQRLMSIDINISHFKQLNPRFDLINFNSQIGAYKCV